MRESGSGSKKTADRFLRTIGVEEDRLHIAARVNDQEAIKNMVSSGLGVSIISKMAARNILAEKRALDFPLDSYASGRTIYLIYRKEYMLAPHIQSFLKFMLKKAEKGGAQ